MPSTPDSYRERIYPSVGVTLAVMALDIAIIFAVWASLDTRIAAVTAVGTISLSALWWFKAISQIDVQNGKLYVNEASIDVEFLTDPRALSEEEWRRRRGVEFDPRLFHAHRFWMKSGVEFTLSDARDPHPGWLVGSKRSEELCGIIAEMIKKD